MEKKCGDLIEIIGIKIARSFVDKEKETVVGKNGINVNVDKSDNYTEEELLKW